MAIAGWALVVFLCIVLVAVAAVAFLIARFLHAVDRDPDSLIDSQKLASDGVSLCLSCVHLEAFPDCPNEFAGESFSAEEGPVYCDDYAPAVDAGHG